MDEEFHEAMKKSRALFPRRSLLLPKTPLLHKEKDLDVAISSNWDHTGPTERSPFESFGTETNRRLRSSNIKERLNYTSISAEKRREPLSMQDQNTLHSRQGSNQKSKLVSVINTKNSKLRTREQELQREILSLSDDLQTLQQELDTGSMKNKLAKVGIEKKKEELVQSLGKYLNQQFVNIFFLLQRKEIKQRQLSRVMFLLQKREEILAAMLRPETSPMNGLAGNLTVPKAILQLVSSGKVQTPRFVRLNPELSEGLSERGSMVDDEEDSIAVGIKPTIGNWANASLNSSEEAEYQEEKPAEIVGNIEDIRELTDEEIDHVVFCTAEMKRAVTKWICEETQRLFRDKAIVGSTDCRRLLAGSSTTEQGSCSARPYWPEP